MQKRKYTENDFMSYIGGVLESDFVEWLTWNAFFMSPASANYHGNYEGGLLDHSIEVTKALVDLTNNNDLKWQRSISPYIVGMFHDLCKIDQYTRITDMGVVRFDYNKNFLIPGHGEKSVQLLAQYIQLTEEEILCIRWHMGAFDEKENWQYYSRAVEQYPNVLWTHTADMIASKIVGV